MSLAERLVAHAREWDITIDAVRRTETSLLGFGAHRNQAVVLKVIRKENSEEWRCGEVLAAFEGRGVVRPLRFTDGAVLLQRLVPGDSLVGLSLNGRDDEATEILAGLLHRIGRPAAPAGRIASVARLAGDFDRFRDQAVGIIPLKYVDHAAARFEALCATQRGEHLLHGDLHHENVLFDRELGWTIIDPWGVVGELEFEIGASLRNPVQATSLLREPAILERRLNQFAVRLGLDANRALQWAFATAVLCILWPFEEGVGQDLREPFAMAAHSMWEMMSI